MIRLLVCRAPRLLACAVLVLAVAAPVQGAQVTIPVATTLPVQILGADGFCTGGWQAGGTASAPTLTCLTGGGGGGPTVPTGCTLVGTPVGSTGGQTTLTASCTGGATPTSFAWTATPTPASGWTNTTTVGTQAPTISATTNFTVTPSNGVGAGNQASATVTVSGGGGGGGGTINCATNALGTAVSGGTQVLDMDWNNPTQLHTASLGQNDAVVVRFTTPNTGATLYAKMSGAEFGGNTAGRFATLSSSACDFRQPPPFSWAGTSYGSSVEILFSVNANPWGYAPLLPGTTYYFNVQTTGSCANCNMLFQMNKY